DVGSDGSAFDAHGGNRSPAENKQRVKCDIDAVGNKQNAHGDRRVAGPAEDGIHDEQHDDHDVTTKHPLRIAVSVLNTPFVGAHYDEQDLREEQPRDGKGNGGKKAQEDRLHSRNTSVLHILFPHPSGDYGSNGGGKSHSYRVQKEKVRLRKSNRSHG